MPGPWSVAPRAIPQLSSVDYIDVTTEQLHALYDQALWGTPQSVAEFFDDQRRFLPRELLVTKQAAVDLVSGDLGGENLEWFEAFDTNSGLAVVREGDVSEEPLFTVPIDQEIALEQFIEKHIPDDLVDSLHLGARFQMPSEQLVDYVDRWS